MAFLAAIPELLGALGGAEAGAGAAEGLGSGRFASMLQGVGGSSPEMLLARESGRSPGLEPGTYKQLSGSEAFFGRGETQADLFPYKFGNVTPGGSGSRYRGGRGFEPENPNQSSAPGSGAPGAPSNVPSPVSPPSMAGSAGAAAPMPTAQLSQPVAATVTPSAPTSPSGTSAPAASPILPPASRGAYRPMNGFSPSRSASFLSGSGRSLVGS